MQNSKSQAGTEVQQSSEVDVTTSSPNNAKPNVARSQKCHCVLFIELEKKYNILFGYAIFITIAMIILVGICQ